MIEADLVDCMVALPGQLFYSTQIPVCLWFIARGKRNGRFRDRRGETLFIDARKLGTMIDRVHCELTGYDDDGNLIPESDIDRIASTYHTWRGGRLPSPSGRGAGGEGYEDVPGFCKAAVLDDIRQHNHILTPGRYVGMAEVEEDDEPFEEKMERLMAQLEAAIRENLGLLWGTEGG